MLIFSKKPTSNSMPASPYTGPSHQAETPMTKALEMYNWLNEKVKIRRVNLKLTPYMLNFSIE